MIQLVKGTKDIYGAEVKAWQEIEGKMRRICETFGIGEIRTPAFEFTELFARGVGETPVTAITEGKQFTGTVTWSPEVSTFAASTVYTATITLTPKAGYKLDGVAANFFTVAGATSVSNGANSGVVTTVFPATKEAAT